MKKNLFYSLVVLLLVFTGCSQKDVEVDTSEQNVNTNGMSGTAGQDGTVNPESNLNNIDSVDGSVDAQNAQAVQAIENEVFEPVLFGFDKFNLSPEMLDIARKNSTKVVMMGGNVSVKLEGNCDEWGSDEYNYALGLKRAKTVKDVLVSEGYNAEKVSLVSFGESNPVCSEKNESCWSKNRRVDFKISQ